MTLMKIKLDLSHYNSSVYSSGYGCFITIKYVLATQKLVQISVKTINRWTFNNTRTHVDKQFYKSTIIFSKQIFRNSYLLTFCTIYNCDLKLYWQNYFALILVLLSHHTIYLVCLYHTPHPYLLYFKVGNFRYINLCSCDNFLHAVISLVDQFYIFSISSIKHCSCGDYTEWAYSKWLLTEDL